MNPEKIEEGLRLIGEGNARIFTACNINRREMDWKHPLATAHRSIGVELMMRGQDAVVCGLQGADFYGETAGRAPEKWRLEGERAARMFSMGVMFVEALEARAVRVKLASQAEPEVTTLASGPERRFGAALLAEAGVA